MPVGSAVLLAGVVLALAACGGGNGGADTHPLGEKVAVGHVERTSTGARGESTMIGMTVLKVRKGSQQDLTKHGFEVDDDGKDTTPYYVDARFENQGQATVKRNLDVSAEDTDGNLIGRTLIFNYGDRPFPPCTEVTKGKLAPGQSYESCTLILVPNDKEIGKVSFLSDNGADTPPEFVYWDPGF